MNGDSVEKPTSTVDVEVGLSAERKSFVADNGIRYYWDEGEQDWVEDDGEIEVDEPEPEKGKAIKRELEDDSDSDDDETNNGEEVKKKQDSKADNKEGGSDEKKDEGAEKKKRKNRKKKKRKGPNHWIYITGLPKDVTFEELKNHFSKVHPQLIPYKLYTRITPFLWISGWANRNQSVRPAAEDQDLPRGRRGQ
jgi:cobalamin biosynthesis protein CobT